MGPFMGAGIATAFGDAAKEIGDTAVKQRMFKLKDDEEQLKRMELAQKQAQGGQEIALKAAELQQKGYKNNADIMNDTLKGVISMLPHIDEKDYPSVVNNWNKTFAGIGGLPTLSSLKKINDGSWSVHDVGGNTWGLNSKDGSFKPLVYNGQPLPYGSPNYHLYERTDEQGVKQPYAIDMKRPGSGVIQPMYDGNNPLKNQPSPEQNLNNLKANTQIGIAQGEGTVDRNTAAALNIKIPDNRKEDLEVLVRGIKTVMGDYVENNPDHMNPLEMLVNYTKPESNATTSEIKNSLELSKKNPYQALKMAYEDPNHRLNARAKVDLPKIDGWYKRVYDILDEIASSSPYAKAPTQQGQSSNTKKNGRMMGVNAQGQVITYNQTTNRWE